MPGIRRGRSIVVQRGTATQTVEVLAEAAELLEGNAKDLAVFYGERLVYDMEVDPTGALCLWRPFVAALATLCTDAAGVLADRVQLAARLDAASKQLSKAIDRDEVCNE